MVEMLVADGLDMVTGTRVTQIRAAYRLGHRFGNGMLTRIVGTVFGNRVTDMLSGYRVFSRRFVKSFPALSSGFETETEFTIHALELKMPLGELETPYLSRRRTDPVDHCESDQGSAATAVFFSLGGIFIHLRRRSECADLS